MQISDISKIITNKVNGCELSNENYISTENMLPNCGGVTSASSVPTTKVTSFLEGDVLLSNIRPYFKKVWFARFDGGCSNDVICLRADKNKCLPQYLYYTLSTDKFIDSFSASSKGTKMPRGDKNALLSYDFPERSIEEQLYIVDILGSIDAKIENNQKLKIELCNYRYAIFQEKFILAAEKSPTNFRKISLSELMDYAGGSQPPASEFINEYKDGYVRFLQIRDYENDNHITYIPISKKNKLCDEWDILIARYGASLGRICSGKIGAYNVALAKILPKKEYYREFLRTYVTAEDFYKALNSKGERSAQAGFNQGDIDTFHLWFPFNENTVKEFDFIAKNIYEKILMIEKESAKLNELKQLYLKKFFG